MKNIFGAMFTLVFAIGLSGSPVFAIEKGVQRPPGTAVLKPNEYIWNPEASPSGPVASSWILPTR